MRKRQKYPHSAQWLRPNDASKGAHETRQACCALLRVDRARASPGQSRLQLLQSLLGTLIVDGLHVKLRAQQLFQSLLHGLPLVLASQTLSEHGKPVFRQLLVANRPPASPPKQVSGRDEAVAARKHVAKGASSLELAHDLDELFSVTRRD